MEVYHVVLLVVAAGIGVLYIVQRFTGINYISTIIQWKPV